MNNRKMSKVILVRYDAADFFVIVEGNGWQVRRKPNYHTDFASPILDNGGSDSFHDAAIAGLGSLVAALHGFDREVFAPQIYAEIERIGEHGILAVPTEVHQ